MKRLMIIGRVFDISVDLYQNDTFWNHTCRKSCNCATHTSSDYTDMRVHGHQASQSSDERAFIAALCCLKSCSLLPTPTSKKHTVAMRKPMRNTCKTRRTPLLHGTHFYRRRSNHPDKQQNKSVHTLNNKTLPTQHTLHETHTHNLLTQGHSDEHNCSEHTFLSDGQPSNENAWSAHGPS